MAVKSISDIRIVGGHPAIDLVNTVDARRDRWGPDALTKFDDVMIWARRAELLSDRKARELGVFAEGNPAEGSQALERLRAARELIYDVLLAEARGNQSDRNDIAALSALADESVRYRHFANENARFRWHWDPTDLNTVLHRVVVSAVELLLDDNRRCIRECTGRNCGWLFLDSSKGGRRRWCSDAGCGTRERVHRSRTRRIDG